MQGGANCFPPNCVAASERTVTAVASQTDLFGAPPTDLPEGFRYEPDLLNANEEEDLIRQIQELELAPFEFHGFIGKRRVISFGWRYDFNGGGLQRIEEIPSFLDPLRQSAARFSAIPASALQQVLVTEYSPGATIGWHKDRRVFGDVVGVSLLTPCTFRFRRKEGEGWTRRSLIAEPRSGYLLQGSSRTEWEHSIPAVARLRYSITFRTLREG
jgi:alkylated DNA repair dioxygenase AlkB